MNKKGQQWVAATNKMFANFDKLKGNGDISDIESALKELYIRTSTIVDGVTVDERNRIGEKMRFLILEHGERIGVKGWMPYITNGV